MSVDSRFIIKYNYKFYQPRIHKGTEVDLVVVVGDKIFCIECKNFGTMINGNVLDIKWHFISRGKSNLVSNPVLANSRHIRTIKGLFIKNGLEVPEIVNIVCVPDTCNIKSPCSEVMKVSNLLNLLEIETFKEFNKSKVIYLSNILDNIRDNSDIRRL